MKNFLAVKNNQVSNINEIPLLDFSSLHEKIIEKCKKSKIRPICFFGLGKASSVRLFVALADDKNSEILVSSSILNRSTTYPSLTPKVPAFHIFERDFHEEFGIKFEGHPWLKPVSYRKNRFDSNSKIENYPFFEMTGEELHEVAVGPIHAGIIEPGHFRFVCSGETVYHLEIQLGYQHRNLEKLFLDNKKIAPHLAESIAGDTVIGHTLAYLNAVESLTGTEISRRAQIIRIIALELERIAMHLADLSAIANDIAYLMGSAVFGTTRTTVINTLLSICGNRFGRGLLRPGGVIFDVDETLIKKIKTNLAKVSVITDRMAGVMFTCSTVTSRLDKTGTVSKEDAIKIGAVGISARASGVNIDSRINHPFGAYAEMKLKNKYNKTGDVSARTHIRYVEIGQSINIINRLLPELEKDSCSESIFCEIKNNLNPESFVISIVEGWRGEIVHTMLTDEAGQIIKHKIKDPSFNNWYMLALAMRNNGISDFPLCNKSFNLSYCGNDL